MWGKKLQKIKIQNPEVLQAFDEKAQETVLSHLERARLMPYTCMPDECVLDVLSSEGKVGPRIRVRRHRK